MNSKPIALVNICKPEDAKIPPLALLYVGGSLKKAGYAVKVFHFTNEEIPRYAKKIIKFDPLYVGLSVFTGDKTLHSAVFSKEIKRQSEIPVLWGGIHPTLLPNQTLSEDYVDYICMYEGEETVVELTEALNGRRELKGVKGIGYKKNGKPVINPPRPSISNLDDHMLDWSLIDVEKFLEQQWDSKRIIGYITSRGCPFNCAFCYNQVFNRRRWRGYSPEKVTEQIDFLKDQYNVDGIRFYDDLLFANPKRAVHILEKVKLPWYGEIRIGMVNEWLVDKFIETEARELLIGLESGSDRILKLCNKMQTVEQITKGVSLLSKAENIKVVGSMIVGLPTETREEIYQTIDLMLKLADIHPNMRYTVGPFTPYPGSKLYDMAVERGLRPPERTEDWCVLDRWSDRIKPTWLDWTDTSEEFYKIRKYAALLPLKNLGIPLLSDIPERRLKEKDFSHTVELTLLTYIQTKFSRQGSLTRKIGYKILPLLKRYPAG